MKGLVLAGGSGTRLRPITYTGAKQLVPVANKPILFYALEQLAEAGIVEVALVVGETEAQIREAVGDGSQWGLEVTYLRQDQPLGLAHAVLIAKDFIGDDTVIMYLGDNLLRDGVRPFVQQFEESRARARQARLGEEAPTPPSAQILLARVPDPQRFGVVELDEHGCVRRLVEKPAEPASDLALVGVYLFDPSIQNAVANISPSQRGELEITEAIQWLLDHGRKVDHLVLDGWWKDTGSLEPLLEGNHLMLAQIATELAGSIDAATRVEGRVQVADGAVITGSVLRGPVSIAAGCRVTNSYVGPYTAIGPGCEVTDSEIENSILLAGCRVLSIPRLTDSLVGRDAVLRRSDQRPQASRVMIGDDSQVDLGS